MELSQHEQTERSSRSPSLTSPHRTLTQLDKGHGEQAAPFQPMMGWDGAESHQNDAHSNSATALMQLKRRLGLDTEAAAFHPQNAVLPLQARPNLSVLQRRVQDRNRPVQAKEAEEAPESASAETDQAPMQARSSSEGLASESAVRSSSGGGAPLHEGVRSKMEGAFGADLSSVRVHQDASADSIGALAYTQGEDIHFANGQYDPESVGGQELLGHELTHVLQQRAGRVDIPQGKGLPINDDTSLEAEADVLGAKAAQGLEVDVPGHSRSLASPTMPFQAKMAAPVQRSVSTSAPIQMARKPLDASQITVIEDMLREEEAGEHAELVKFFKQIQDAGLRKQALEEMWQSKSVDDTWYKSGFKPTIDDWEDFGNIARKYVQKDKQNRPPAPTAPTSGMNANQLGNVPGAQKPNLDVGRERADRTEGVLEEGSKKQSGLDTAGEVAETGHEIASGANDLVDAGTNALAGMEKISEGTKEGIGGVTPHVGGGLSIVGGLKDMYGGGKDVVDGSLQNADRVEGAGKFLAGSNDVVQGSMNIAGTALGWSEGAMTTLGGVGSIVTGGIQMAMGTYSLIKNWSRTDDLGKQSEKLKLKLDEVGRQIEDGDQAIRLKAGVLTTEEAQLGQEDLACKAAQKAVVDANADFSKERHRLNNKQIRERQDQLAEQKKEADKKQADLAAKNQAFQTKLDALRQEVEAVKVKVAELEKLKNAEEATLLAQGKTGFERNSAVGDIVKGAALVAGGILLLALGASNPIGWIVLAGAAVLGGVLLLVNWWRKSKQKEELTDRLLGTDDKLAAYNSGKAKNQQLSKSKMRQQLLEKDGFANVNSFYKEYIQLNSAYLNNVLTQADQNPALQSETEVEAAVGTVRGLGLKLDFTSHRVPSTEDIADKMGL